MFIVSVPLSIQTTDNQASDEFAFIPKCKLPSLAIGDCRWRSMGCSYIRRAGLGRCIRTGHLLVEEYDKKMKNGQTYKKQSKL